MTEAERASMAQYMREWAWCYNFAGKVELRDRALAGARLVEEGKFG
jgi:hypothetical protein